MEICLVGSPSWAIRMANWRNKTSEYIVKRPPLSRYTRVLRAANGHFYLCSIRGSSRFLYMNCGSRSFILFFRLFSVDSGLTYTISTLSKQAWVPATDKLGGNEEHFDNRNSLKNSPSTFYAIIWAWPSSKWTVVLQVYDTMVMFCQS